MANPKPHTVTKSASDRLEAARKVKDDAIARELAWVAIVVRAKLWDAWISIPRLNQTGFPYILNIETPTGRLIYRLAESEMDMFRDLEERPNDGKGGGWAEKLAILTHLATEGWL
jgi:hypothetical protein